LQARAKGLTLASSMYVYGHRGAAGEAPENTRAAVRQGLAAGSDGIEIDVRLVDGAVVVLHDATLDRTTSASGLVYERSAQSLESILIEGESLPLLADIVAEMDARRLNIELKDVAVAQVVAAMWDGRADWLISSFLPEALARIAVAAPGLSLALCSDQPSQTLQVALDLGCQALHGPCSQINGDLVAAAQKSGFQVAAYTCNDRAQAQRLAVLGCDAIFTDRPSVLVPGCAQW
jgi:glycerophosphoryl diester phosphodiesterase